VFTERGFADYATFEDTYGQTVTVRQSSSAEEHRVWVFCDENGHQSYPKNPPPDSPAPAPHLNVEQAQRLIRALGVFIGGAEDPWPARVKASVEALTHDQPDYQALAGKLAEWYEKYRAALASRPIDQMGASWAMQNLDAAFARYHEATAQHGGREDDVPS